MGERKVSTSSALAHLASCASLSQVSSVRSSGDMLPLRFWASGPPRHRRREGRKPPQEWVERRPRGWCTDRLEHVSRPGYRFRDGAPPGSKCQRRMLGRRLGDVKITTLDQSLLAHADGTN